MTSLLLGHILAHQAKNVHLCFGLLGDSLSMVSEGSLGNYEQLTFANDFVPVRKQIDKVIIFNK